MAFILLDESGDLGFDFSKPKTSKFFIITFLFCNELKPLERIIKKTFAGFSKSEIKSHAGCLHSYKEKPQTRLKVLNLIAKEELSIVSIYLNKRKVYTQLKDEKHVLYNYVTNILLDRIMTKKLISTRDQIELIASKRETNKFLNENFTSYLKNKISNSHKLYINIEIKSHRELKALQVVDFVSWSLYRYREHGDDSYKNIIKNKIIEDNGLFP